MFKKWGLVGRAIRKTRLFWQVGRLNRAVSAHSDPTPGQKPVLFFNASARLEGLNLNGAFQLLTSWGVSLAGRKVVHLGCRSGMSHCVLGAGLGDTFAPPPCKGCIHHTRLFTGGADVHWLEYREDPALRALLEGSSIQELETMVYHDRPLGELVLPSLRWILRRHHLQDDRKTRFLFTEYILSANSIAEAYHAVLDQISPGVVVVFNGLQYPEGVVRWVSLQKGIRVITHEVNLQPFSAFFTDGQATIYPLRIPEEFTLSADQNRILDEYLTRRFKGDFRMAGIKFWADMNQLPEDFLEFAEGFKGIIPVFTNVIFDTSQAHANTLFPDMFAWLDLVLEAAEAHLDFLFVIRAHPDEMRAGKRSQESVTSWAADRQVDSKPNVRLIGPDETLSSYELIQRSKFTLVYNSSIGLEATLLGAAVLCAGRARYTQYPTVFYPQSAGAYQETLESFLKDEPIQIPPEFYQNARKFLFFQLYRASLHFGDFLREHPTPGYVQLKDFHYRALLPGSSETIDCVVAGILEGEEFVLENDTL